MLVRHTLHATLVLHSSVLLRVVRTAKAINLNSVARGVVVVSHFQLIKRRRRLFEASPELMSVFDDLETRFSVQMSLSLSADSNPGH